MSSPPPGYGHEDVQPGPPPWAQPSPAYPPGGYAQAPAESPPVASDYSYPSAPNTVWPVAAPPAARRTRKKTLLVVVVAVVAVVAILLVLDFAGVLVFLPGSGSKSTPSGATALTFVQAESIANQTAAQRGGSWGVAMAEGVQSSESFNPVSDAPCSALEYTPSGPVGETGESYSWGFVYESTPFVYGAPEKFLFVAVVNGTASVTTEVLPGTGCPGIDYPVGSPFPTNMSDSPGVIAAVNADGGSGFLSANPGSLAFLLAGEFEAGSSSFTPVWIVEYDGACSATTSTEAQFGADVYGTNDHVFSHGWSNFTCSPTSSYPYYPVVFTSASSGHSTTGSVFFDNFTLSAPTGLTTADLGLAILEPNRTLVDPGELPGGCEEPPAFSGCSGASGTGGWYAILRSSAGAVVGAYPAATDESDWSVGSPAPSITSAETLELVSTTALTGSGDSLVAFTWNDADVSGSTTL